jgi:hypothetical protein
MFEGLRTPRGFPERSLRCWCRRPQRVPSECVRLSAILAGIFAVMRHELGAR